MRRLLIIVASAIVLLGVGVAGYFYFLNKSPGVEVTAPPTPGLPGSENAPPITGTPGTDPITDTSPISAPPRLVKISSGPVVPGMIVINRKGTASSSPEVITEFIERQNGNVFSYLTNAQTLTRTSNKTVPGIQSARWTPDGAFAFVQYLSGSLFSTINTYALSADGSIGYFLPQNVSDVSVASSSVLTLASGVNGSTASVSRVDGSRVSTLFSTPLTSLRVSFAGKGQYLAFTKPSATLAGSAFLVNASGYFSRIAGPKNGLVALASPLGKWVLVSFVSGETLQMELVNTLTAEKLPLPISTIADKCVWAADDSVVYCGVPTALPINTLYPDAWYQGVARFSDRVWKIEISGRYAQLVLDFEKETEEQLDVQSPAIDALNTTLVFVNKNDGSLWSYSL